VFAMSSPTYTLYHASGMGSTYTLAVLQLLNIPHSVKLFDIDFQPDGIKFGDDASRQTYLEMKALNPLAQFPTLVMDSEGGKVVLTEMAAIALYLQDKHAAGTPWSTAVLTPAQLALFYRLMVYIPANLYAVISILDFPERYVAVPESSSIPAQEIYGWVKDKNMENRKTHYITLENIITTANSKTDSPYALGTTHPTLVDVYIALVAHYSPRPRHTWLEENCPRIYACAKATLRHPLLRKVFLEQDLEHLAEAE